MNVIADTGFLVALLEVHDQYHPWAVGLAERVSWPALTCESVLSETAFHVRSSSLVMEMLNSGLVNTTFDLNAHHAQVFDLAERYADRHPDLADLCLIRMSELYPRHSIVTVDSDFRFYRRNKRDVIPTICPPRK